MIKGQLVLGCDGAISMQFDSNITLLPGQTYNITLEKAPDLHELRALRLWHWKHVCRYADKICDPRLGRVKNREYTNLHAMHMRSVQALNDLFPIGDTAERDHDKELSAVKLR